MNIEQTNRNRTINFQKWLHKKIFDDVILRFKNICKFSSRSSRSANGWGRKTVSNQKISPRTISLDPPPIFPNHVKCILIEQSPFLYRNKDLFLPLRDHLSEKNLVSRECPVNLYKSTDSTIIQFSLVLNFPSKNWKTVSLLLQDFTEIPPSAMTSEPENRIDVSEKEGENFSRGRSVILPDRGRAKVQRSSMMQRSLNESRPLASDDDASFINPGHESEREREKERQTVNLRLSRGSSLLSSSSFSSNSKTEAFQLMKLPWTGNYSTLTLSFSFLRSVLARAILV